MGNKYGRIPKVLMILSGGSFYFVYFFFCRFEKIEN